MTQRPTVNELRQSLALTGSVQFPNLEMKGHEAPGRVIWVIETWPGRRIEHGPYVTRQEANAALARVGLEIAQLADKLADVDPEFAKHWRP